MSDIKITLSGGPLDARRRLGFWLAWTLERIFGFSIRVDGDGAYGADRSIRSIHGIVTSISIETASNKRPNE